MEDFPHCLNGHIFVAMDACRYHKGFPFFFSNHQHPFYRFRAFHRNGERVFPHLFLFHSCKFSFL